MVSVVSHAGIGAPCCCDAVLGINLGTYQNVVEDCSTPKGYRYRRKPGELTTLLPLAFLNTVGRSSVSTHPDTPLPLPVPLLPLPPPPPLPLPPLPSTHNTTQHNTTQHNTTQHNTTQHNTTQHNTTQHNTTQHNTTQHNTTQHNTTQHNTTQHNTTQHNTTHKTHETHETHKTHKTHIPQTNTHIHLHMARFLCFCTHSSLLFSSCPPPSLSLSFCPLLSAIGKEEIKCHNKVDKMNRVDLPDSLRLLKKISDEAEILLEQRRLQEEDVWNIFEQHMESWECTEKNIYSIYDKDWLMNQSSDPKGNL